MFVLGGLREYKGCIDRLYSSLARKKKTMCPSNGCLYAPIILGKLLFRLYKLLSDTLKLLICLQHVNCHSLVYDG